MGALLYLHFTSVRGRIRSRLRRLKQPKYLLGALVGAAYVYYIFIRRMGRGYGPQSYGNPDHGINAYTQAPGVPTDVLSIAVAIGTLVVLIVALLSWTLPRAAPTLAFSEAEIAFLFPAPISRRTLINYRLLKTLLTLAFTSALLTLFSNRWSFLGGSAAIHAVGWWLILSTLSLHATGSSFALARLRNRGVSPWMLSVGVLAVGVLAVAGVAIWIRAHAPVLAGGEPPTPRILAEYVLGLMQSGPISWLLAVPRFLLAPFAAPDGRAFWLALGPALLVLGAHYAWVLTTEVSFEEASVARAEKRAARTLALRQGKSPTAGAAAKSRPAPFPLASAGRPEIAFLWKNLLSTSTLLRPRAALIAAAIIVAVCTWLATHPLYSAFLPAVATIGAFAAAFTLLLGPQLARFDLRADLPNCDLLMTYPMRGWQIVFGELLAPLSVLTVIAWLALLAIVMAVPDRISAVLSSEARVGIAVGIALLVPPFCALQLLVSNALALIFPAWVQAVSNRGEHGLDVLGQRILFLAGRLLATVLGLAPAAIGAGVVFAVTLWIVGPVVASVLAGAAVVAILCAEVWAGIQWLGSRLERFDLSSELRP